MLFSRIFSCLIIISMGILSCNKTDKPQSDSLYSRHLQRSVELVIFHTKIPSDRSQLNLLLLNDGQDVQSLHAFETIDSLFQAGAIGPVVAVAIKAGDRMKEYGLAGKPDFAGRGSKADHYDAFIANELLPFIRKKTGTRSFHRVAIAGSSLGGLSAFDIAWNHADKFQAAGIFSGSFWWRDKDTSDSTYSDETNRLAIAKLKASRKSPDTRFFFYAGKKEETSDRDKDGIPDVIDDTKDVMATMTSKRKISPSQITYVESPTGVHDWPSWAAVFPQFMVWAFPK